MLITPSTKGQITKAIEAAKVGYNTNFLVTAQIGVRRVLEKKMPKQQAKHAARRIINERCERASNPYSI